MTAFGRAQSVISGKEITVELKSVNFKGFDCSVRLARSYGFAEEAVRPAINAAGIKRGKLDVNIEVELLQGSGVRLRLDHAYLESYLELLRELADSYQLKDDISVMTVAKNKDVFLPVNDKTESEEQICADIISVLNDALAVLLERRLAEGAALEADIRAKIDGMRRLVDEVEVLCERDVRSYRARLEERLRRVLDDYSVKADEARILTECAIFADKVAIDEEIVRLRAHFDAFLKFFDEDEPVGRRMDFLTQEINREINTIGSKSSSSEILAIVVTLKNEAEKIREQIQNLE